MIDLPIADDIDFPFELVVEHLLAQPVHFVDERAGTVPIAPENQMNHFPPPKCGCGKEKLNQDFGHLR
jgi:hypothetical protein